VAAHERPALVDVRVGRENEGRHRHRGKRGRKVVRCEVRVDRGADPGRSLPDLADEEAAFLLRGLSAAEHIVHEGGGEASGVRREAADDAGHRLVVETAKGVAVPLGRVHGRDGTVHDAEGREARIARIFPPVGEDDRGREGPADEDRPVEPEVLREFPDVFGVAVHRMPGEDLARVAVAPEVRRDDAELPPEDLRVQAPEGGRTEPAVEEDDRPAAAPVLIVESRPVRGLEVSGDFAHDVTSSRKEYIGCSGGERS